MKKKKIIIIIKGGEKHEIVPERFNIYDAARLLGRESHTSLMRVAIRAASIRHAVFCGHMFRASRETIKKR